MPGYANNSWDYGQISKILHNIPVVHKEIIEVYHVGNSSMTCASIESIRAIYWNKYCLSRQCHSANIL